MKLITTKIHGFLDYIVGIFLLAAPLTFHLPGRTPEGLIFFILGAGLLFYSMITNYEWGIFKLIPMNIHLLLDILSGIFLTVSLWLFAFADRV